MEFQKITNLLDTTSDNTTKKQIEVHDQVVLKIDIKQVKCKYGNAYLVVKRDVAFTIAADENFIEVRNKFLAFKSCLIY